MTTPLMPLHITPDAKSLTTSLVRAQERLLARVAVAVDLEAAGARESFVARRADVAVLHARVGLVLRHVVVVPCVVRGENAGGYHWGCDYGWWEVRGQRSLGVDVRLVEGFGRVVWCAWGWDVWTHGVG